MHIPQFSHFNVLGIAYDNAPKYIQVLIKSHCPIQNLSPQGPRVEDRRGLVWR